MKRTTTAGYWIILACCCLAAVSCKREPASQSASPPVELRGEPIRVQLVSTAPINSIPTGSVTEVSQPQPAPTEEKSGEHLIVGFDRLAAFNYDVSVEPVTNTVPTTSSTSQIPESVQAFDKKKVALKGFMLPLKVEGGLVTELLIMRDQSMCCYGTVPKINEWVSVKMASKGVKPIMDQPVTLYGTLHVGEMRENGYLVGIYALDGEKMAGPLGL